MLPDTCTETNIRLGNQNIIQMTFGCHRELGDCNHLTVISHKMWNKLSKTTYKKNYLRLWEKQWFEAQHPILTLFVQTRIVLIYPSNFFISKFLSIYLLFSANNLIFKLICMCIYMYVCFLSGLFFISSRIFL